jgi:hypothetical protein
MSKQQARQDWISLKDALWYALYGVNPSTSPLPEAEDAERLPPFPGSLLYEVKREDIPRQRRGFDIALSRAALDGKVHFLGCRSKNAPPEPIHSTYFVEARGFDTYGLIRPWPFDPLAHRRPEPIQDGATWSQVTVDRGEFFGWLADEFSHVDPLGEAIQMSRTGAQGRPTARHLVEQELDRRSEAGEIAPGESAVKISEDLANWYSEFRRMYPKLPGLKSETIRKFLRGKIRSVKEKAGRK